MHFANCKANQVIENEVAAEPNQYKKIKRQLPVLKDAVRDQIEEKPK